MSKRFVSIWFDHLKTDWFTIRQPELKNRPFVLRTTSHGRLIICAANEMAEMEGINSGMVLADARALIPALEVKDDIPDLPEKLLKKLALWCIRFSPFVALDLPDGLIIDATGCAHLWGGDDQYIDALSKKLNQRGYSVKLAMSDTAGASWALAHYSATQMIVEEKAQAIAILPLPPAALRIEADIAEKLCKLGLNRIRDFIGIPRSALKRRFGQTLITRINQALGFDDELFEPVQPLEPYEERLPCLEPIISRTGVEIGLSRLLELLCQRLVNEQKGLRNAFFKTYRSDGKITTLVITTSYPSHHAKHLFKLFEDKLVDVEVESGIELFTLTTTIIEDHFPVQEKIWESAGGLNDTRLAELIDRISIHRGLKAIERFLPVEHHLPEKSYRPANSLVEEMSTVWKSDQPRPTYLLSPPEQIEVTAPIPDYPPMIFRYKGKIHKVIKADGPERIEQEWWVQRGRHRDYYQVEDEEGKRYWLFRSGHYDETSSYKWFIHGFFA